MIITFTDANGNEHKHELADNASVEVQQPDGSIEVDISYLNGRLRGVFTLRPNGSPETAISYKDGQLAMVSTATPDDSVNAAIEHINGRLVCYINGRPVYTQ